MRVDDPLWALLESAEHERAVEERRRLWRSRETEASLATWQGALSDLAEARARVSVELAGGRRRHGFLHSVGHDHLLLSSKDPRGFDQGSADEIAGEQVAVSLSAVRSLRYVSARRRTPPLHSDRVPPVRRHLIEMLESLSTEGVPITIALRSSKTIVQGERVRVGVDLLVAAGPEDVITIVPVSAISDVSWRRS